MTRPSTRPPSQNPVFLNSHSKQPVSGQFQLRTPFFASRGCRLTKASDVHAWRKSSSPYLRFYCTCRGSWLKKKTFLVPSRFTRDQRKPIFPENIEEEGWRWGNLLPGGQSSSQSFSLIIWNVRTKALGRRNRNLIWTAVFLVQNDDSTSRLSSVQAKRIWRVTGKDINLQRILTSAPN